ncbi:MAG: flagellar export chaperone FliS [Myxococcota bacterium]
MRGLAAYKKVSTHSAPPERLLLMLYERAIQEQQLAIVALQEKRTMDASHSLRRTREIFVELASALDHEAAPEISLNLHRLYMWSIKELLRAGQEIEPMYVEQCLERTQELYTAFKSALTSGDE